MKRNVILSVFLISFLSLGAQVRRSAEREKPVHKIPKSSISSSQWARTFDLDDRMEFRPYAVQRTTDGGYVVVGYHGTTDYNFKWAEMWILKLKPAGVIDWQLYLQGEPTSSPICVATRIQQTRDGGYAVAGRINSNAVLIKLSSGGAVEWKRSFSIDVNLWAGERWVEQTGDGGYAIAGDKSGSLQVMKLGPSGGFEWQKNYGGSDFTFKCLQSTGDGGLVVLGDDKPGGSSKSQPVLIKLDSTGNVDWRTALIYPDSSYSVIPAWIEQSADGGYVVAGNGFRSYDPEWLSLTKLSQSGNVEWHKKYNQTSYARCLRPAADGYLLVGYDILLKLDFSGDVQWGKSFDNARFNSGQQTYDGGFIFVGDLFDKGLVVKTDPQGNISGCSYLKGVSAAAFADSIVAAAGSATGVPESQTVGDPTVSVLNKQAVANDLCLVHEYTLKIAASPGGTTDPSPGEYVHSEGSQVKVRAIPDSGYKFTEWTGDVPEGHKSDGSISLDMTGDKSVKANFIQIHTLTVSASPGGTTTPSPGSYSYVDGTVIDIGAIPDSTYWFADWSGDVPEAQKSANPVSLTLNADKSLTARFLKIKPPANVKAEKKANRSLLQVEYINVLSWQANPDNILIANYRIYQIDGDSSRLLKEVNSQTFTFSERRVSKNREYHYALSAVNWQGREGERIVIAVK